MADARHDPFTGRWVIVAPGRAQRPDTVAPHRTRPGDTAPRDEPDPGGCPFCPGNERLTPPEIARTGQGTPGVAGWRTRVFPNRYPIVDDGAAVAGHDDDPLRGLQPARGAHEVLALSPDHRRSLGRLDPRQVGEILKVMRDRARVHAAAGHTSTQLIVNHGAAGGASLSHPHAQIVAVDLDPPAVLDEAARFDAGDGCLVCAELARHRVDPVLVVAAGGDPAREASGGGADLWCPWASGTAFEMVLAPTRHRARFEDADEELADVADALHDGLGRLDRALGDPPYNLAVHSRPASVTSDYHWHVHVWPRIEREAGFERGSGLLVNVVDPTHAAARLRASPRTR